MLEKIWIASGYLDAQIIKQYLESFGIEVFTFEESIGLLYGLTTTPLGEVEIFVRKEDKQAALGCMEQYEAAQDEGK